MLQGCFESPISVEDCAGSDAVFHSQAIHEDLNVGVVVSYCTHCFFQVCYDFSHYVGCLLHVESSRLNGFYLFQLDIVSVHEVI